MFKKIFHAIGKKFARSGSETVIPTPSQSQFLFTSLLVVIGATLIVFWPTFGLNGLFIKNLFFPIATSVLLIAVAIMSLRDGAFVLIDKLAAGIVLGSLAALLVACLFAASTRNSLFGGLNDTPSFLLILGLVIVAYIAAISIKRFTQILGLMVTIASVYTIAFLHVIIRLIFGPQVLSFGFLNTLTSSLLGSWKDFAVLSLLMVIFAVICLEIGKFTRAAKWIAVAVGIMGIIGLFITNISWVWIVAGAIMIIISVYLFALAYWDRAKSTYEKGRIIPWYSLAVFILVITGILFGGFITGMISRVRPIYYQETYPSFTSTMKAGWASIKHHPIGGYGLGSFDAAWNQVKPLELSGSAVGTTEFTSGSSFMTTVIATTGILGLLAWLALIILILYRFVVVIRNGFDEPSERFTGILSIISALLLSIIVWIDFPGIGILVLWVVFLGSLWSFSTKKMYQKSFIRDPKTSFVGIIAVIALIVAGSLLLYLSVRKTASAFAYSSALKSYSTNDVNLGNNELARANSLWFTDYYNRALAGQVLSQAANLQPSADVPQDALARQVQQILSAALSYANAATNLDESNYRNWIALGNVYQFFDTLKVDGAGERAIAAYDKAVTLSPNDRTLDLLYVNLALAEGKTETALELVNNSIVKQPTVDAYVWLYRYHMELKQYDSAEKDLINAISLRPSDNTLVTEIGALYFTRGDYSSAANAFTQSLSLNSSQPIVYAYLGVALERAGKQEDANKIYQFLRQQLPTQANGLITAAKNQSPEVQLPEPATTDTATPTKQ